MGLAAQKTLRGKRPQLPLYSPDYALGVSVFARRYFEILFGRINGSCMFVFDNYQDMPVNSEFHGMMSHVLSAVPEGITVIILSRKDLPQKFARLQAHGIIRLIGWDEIRFTPEEAQALIEEKGRGRVKAQELQHLCEKTDGWAAGLMLCLRGMDRNDYLAGWMDIFTKKNISDYFAHEVFHHFDKEMRDFLLKTSFLPSMTLKMVSRLEGIKNAEAIQNRLVKDYCFVKTYSQDDVVYRYHPLFREFLTTMAKKTYSRDTLTRIKNDAAIVLAEGGSVEDAMQLLNESGDMERMTAIIQKYAASMVRQGRYQTLSSWLEMVPGEMLTTNPWLVYWKGVCQLPFQPAESRGFFERAFDCFSSQNEASGAFLSWAGIVEAIMYGREGLKTLDKWLPVINTMLNKFKRFPSGEIEADVTCSVFRVLSLRKPLHFDTEQWLPRIHAIAQKSTDVSQKIRALTSLAHYFYSCGEFRRLEVILASLSDLLQRYEVPPLTRLTVYWLRAAFHNAMSMYGECLHDVSEGLELARNLKINVMEYMLLGHGVLSSLKQGNLSRANQYLLKMASALALIKPWEAGFYHYCAAWEALYRKQVTQASTHTEYCLELYKEIGNPWTLTISYILEGVVLHASGNIRKALKSISQARSLGSQTKNLFTPFMCDLIDGYLYLQQGKDEDALAAFRKGLGHGKENGFVNLFMWPPGLLETVLTKALEQGIEEEYAKQLIRRNDLLPLSHHEANERWPWPIKIYTLGRFGVIRDGNPVQFTGKIPQKPLFMLKALIAFGGREVSEERLTDILWPEADGDAAHSSFATTLSRLRQFLGDEKVIGCCDGKAMLDPRYCYVDVWSFERLLGEAFSLLEKGNSGRELEDALKLSQKVIRMYTGPFLGGENEPWMVSIRERLRNKVIRMIRTCGRYLEEAGELENSLECYQKGLEVDDLIEEFYRRMMKCHYRLGRRAEALSVYKQCSLVLSSVLGIHPSEETEALARELKR